MPSGSLKVWQTECSFDAKSPVQQSQLLLQYFLHLVAEFGDPVVWSIVPVTVFQNKTDVCNNLSDAAVFILVKFITNYDERAWKVVLIKKLNYMSSVPDKGPQIKNLTKLNQQLRHFNKDLEGFPGFYIHSYFVSKN